MARITVDDVLCTVWGNYVSPCIETGITVFDYAVKFWNGIKTDYRVKSIEKKRFEFEKKAFAFISSHRDNFEEIVINCFSVDRQTAYVRLKSGEELPTRDFLEYRGIPLDSLVQQTVQ